MYLSISTSKLLRGNLKSVPPPCFFYFTLLPRSGAQKRKAGFPTFVMEIRPPPLSGWLAVNHFFSGMENNPSSISGLIIASTTVIFCSVWPLIFMSRNMGTIRPPTS